MYSTKTQKMCLDPHFDLAFFQESRLSLYNRVQWGDDGFRKRILDHPDAFRRKFSVADLMRIVLKNMLLAIS